MNGTSRHLLKQFEIPSLIELITERLANRDRPKTRSLESVATIPERKCSATIQDWLIRVEGNKELTQISLKFEERTGHLPQLLRELIVRLRKRQKIDMDSSVSDSAWQHGRLRFRQGYSAAAIVGHRNLRKIDQLGFFNYEVADLREPASHEYRNGIISDWLFQ